jgi:hypothetical protein
MLVLMIECRKVPVDMDNVEKENPVDMDNAENQLQLTWMSS